MSITPSNISLGVCDVVFDGVDLGSTKGGVQVEIKTNTYEVTVDQAGDSPLKDVITGTTVTVTVPLAETNLSRLQSLMPQSVSIPASGSAPTGFSVNNTSGYAVGASSAALTAGTGTPTAGMTFKFSGHATVYRVVSYVAAVISFVQNSTGTGGLVAPVVDEETITFTAKTAGVEIRSGVNTDLLEFSAILKLHPTGLSADATQFDFTVMKAVPVPNFTFKYANGEERIYEVTFKGAPDFDHSGRIAFFGAVS